MSAQSRNQHDDTNGLVAAGEWYRQMSEPAVKAVARSSAEMMCLLSRRSQAYLEAPARFVACQSPQELASEQMRFLHTAWTQYSECATRMMSVYPSVFPAAAGMMNMWTAAARMPASALAAATSRQRDYLGDDRDTGDAAEGNGGDRNARSRRAA